MLVDELSEVDDETKTIWSSGLRVVPAAIEIVRPSARMPSSEFGSTGKFRSVPMSTKSGPLNETESDRPLDWESELLVTSPRMELPVASVVEDDWLSAVCRDVDVWLDSAEDAVTENASLRWKQMLR